MEVCIAGNHRNVDNLMAENCLLEATVTVAGNCWKFDQLVEYYQLLKDLSVEKKPFLELVAAAVAGCGDFVLDSDVAGNHLLKEPQMETDVFVEGWDLENPCPVGGFSMREAWLFFCKRGAEGVGDEGSRSSPA
ncbi:hypothetical protein SLE2022_069420 [Rubroshorea leprosula]